MTKVFVISKVSVYYNSIDVVQVVDSEKKAIEYCKEHGGFDGGDEYCIFKEWKLR